MKGPDSDHSQPAHLKLRATCREGPRFAFQSDRSVFGQQRLCQEGRRKWQLTGRNRAELMKSRSMERPKRATSIQKLSKGCCVLSILPRVDVWRALAQSRLHIRYPNSIPSVTSIAKTSSLPRQVLRKLPCLIFPCSWRMEGSIPELCGQRDA